MLYLCECPGLATLRRMNPASPLPSSSHVTHLNSDAFARLGLPFSEIVRVGDMLHLSGQMGTAPGSLKLVEGGVRAEAAQALRNIQAALEAHG